MAPAEVQAWPPRTLSTLGGPKSTQLCTSFAHDACALKPGPAEALLRDNPFGRSHLKSDARVDTSTVRYIRCCVRPMRQEVVIPTRSKNRVRIDLEGEVLQSIVKTQQQLFFSSRI